MSTKQNKSIWNFVKKQYTGIPTSILQLCLAICALIFSASIAFAESKTQQFGSSKYENITLYLGSNGSVTCTFYIDGVFGNSLNSFRTDWYSTPDTQGESGFIESDASNAGNGYWDPEVTRTYYATGTYYVRGEVMTRNNVLQSFRWKETHQWTITVLGDTTSPTNPTSWGGDATNVWRTDNTVYVSWSGASDNVGIKGYYYAWSTNSSYNVTTSDTYVSNTSGSHNRTSNALSDGSWYFHIRYVDTSNNLASNTADRGLFKIDKKKPSKPILIWPENNDIIDTRRPKLDWEDTTDDLSEVVEYEITYETDSWFDEKKVYSASSNYQINENLPFNEWIYWRVRAKDAAGNWSDLSQERKFKVLGLPNLIVTDIWVNKSTPLDAGDKVSVFAKVKNTGNVKANPSLIDNIWTQLKVNNQIVGHSNGQFLNYVMEIKVNEERTYEFSDVIVPHSSSMTCLVIADTHSEADKNNRVNESSEFDNDDFLKQFTVNLLGTINVAITPASAVSAGAKWKATKSGHDTGWQDSGASPSVPVGDYIISFNMPSSWNSPSGSGAKPADITNVSVSSGGNVQRTGTYRRIVSAVWNTSNKTVIAGTLVPMRAVVEGFASGTQFSFTINESDPVRGGNVYSGSCDLNGVVTAQWPSVWEDDWWGNPEFSFAVRNASALNDMTLTVVSRTSPDDLTVQEDSTSAEITAFTFPELPANKMVKPGDMVKATVTIKNTGNRTRSFWVGLSFESPLAAGREWPSGWLDVPPLETSVALSPNASETVSFTYMIPDDVPIGTYNAVSIIWDGFNGQQMLEPQYDSEKRNAAFIVSDSGLPDDPYGLQAIDAGGLFATIKKGNRRNLVNLAQTLAGTLKDANHEDVALSSSASHVAILIHGWNPSHENTGFGGTMGTLADNLTSGKLPSNWSLVKYEWPDDAATGHLFGGTRAERESRGIVVDFFLVWHVATELAEANAIQSAERGYQHGIVIGKRLVEQVGAGNLKQVHLIGHSAGSWAVYAALRYLRENSPDTQVQVTYLDPFIPDRTTTVFTSHAFKASVLEDSLNYANVTTVGAMKADGYYSKYHDMTNLAMSPCFSTEIPWLWEQSKQGCVFLTDYAGAPTGWYGHSGPVKFYADTVTNPDRADALGHGWKHSLAHNGKPVIRLTPGSIDFGEVVHNSSKSLPVTIWNDGDAVLHVDGISHTGNPPFSGTWNGDIQPGGSRKVDITFGSSASGAYTSTLTVISNASNSDNQLICLGTLVAADEEEEEDIEPDPFYFTDQTNVALSTLCPSNPITISGINAPSPISISGNSGEYQVNGAEWTSNEGYVNNGDTITVRQTSSAKHNESKHTSLDIGVVSDTFTVTTEVEQVSNDPTVTSISPSHGYAAGGTSVAIIGTNFINVTAVKFGAIPVGANNFTVNSTTQITATAPAGSAGSKVDVSVTTNAGTSANTTADDYTYDGVTTAPNWSEQFDPGQFDSRRMNIYVLLKLNGEPIATPGSILAAFQDDLIGGVKTLTSEDIASYPVPGTFALAVCNDSSRGSIFTLKVYDALSQTIYSVAQPISFVNAGNAGTVEVPLVFDVGVRTMSLQVAQGYNWISFNVAPNDATLSTVLSGLTLSKGDTIQKQSGNLSTYFNGNWLSPFSIEPGVMYLLKKGSGGAQNVDVSGAEASSTLTVKAGWNWLGNPLSQAASLASLSLSSGFTKGDTMQSQSGNLATWYNGTWLSGFSMEPGKGYVLKVAKEGNLTFAPTGGAMRGVGVSAGTRSVPEWIFEESQFDSRRMNIYAIVDLSGNRISGVGSTLAAFQGDTAVGVKELTQNDDGYPEDGTFALVVANDSDIGGTFTLKVYDVNTDAVYNIEGQIQFVAGATSGTVEAPVMYNAIAPDDVTHATLTMAKVGHGTVTPAQGAHEVPLNVAQDITATADANWHFVNWTVTGGATVADANMANTTVTLTADGTVTANFAEDPKYRVTVERGSGDGDYHAGATVSITAAATLAGQEFTGWTSADGVVFANAAAPTTSFVMPAKAVTVTATYRGTDATLTMVVVGNGTVTPAPGAHEVPLNVPQNITADADANCHFVNWTATGGATVADPNDATTTVTLTADGTVTAHFVEDVKYPVVVVSGTGDGNYYADATVSITADAAPAGQKFAGWASDDGVGFANAAAPTTTFVMPAKAVTVTATYQPITYTITLVSRRGVLVDATGWVFADGQYTRTFAGVLAEAILFPAVTPDVPADWQFAQWTVTAYSGTDAAFVSGQIVAQLPVGFTGNITLEAGYSWIGPNPTPWYPVYDLGNTEHGVHQVKVYRGNELVAGMVVRGAQVKPVDYLNAGCPGLLSGVDYVFEVSEWNSDVLCQAPEVVTPEYQLPETGAVVADQPDADNVVGLNIDLPMASKYLLTIKKGAEVYFPATELVFAAANEEGMILPNTVRPMEFFTAGTYDVAVLAINPMGEAAQATTCQIVIGQPVAPSDGWPAAGFTPVEGQNFLLGGDTIPVLFSWPAIVQAEAYDLLVYESNGRNVATQSDLADCHATVLLSAGVYFWRVVAVGADGQELSSPGQNFAVIADSDAPIINRAAAAAGKPNAVVLFCDPASSNYAGVSYEIQFYTAASGWIEFMGNARKAAVFTDGDQDGVYECELDLGVPVSGGYLLLRSLVNGRQLNDSFVLFRVP